MKTRTPLVSVIVTTYNRKKLLKETIDSILNQTFTDFELIVVDNYSNYDFVAYMASFNDSRIRAYQNQNDGIIAVNRNYGIKKAKGEYIAFCDDDDLWLPDKLDIQINNLLYKNDYVAVGSQYETIGEKYIPRKKHKTDIIIDFNKAISYLTVPLSSLLVKNIGCFFDENRSVLFVEDKDYQLNLIKKSGKNILLLKQTLIQYRIHTGNNASDSFRKLNNINIYKKYKRVLPLNKYEYLYAKSYIQGSTVELRDNDNGRKAREYCFKAIGINHPKWNVVAVLMIIASFLPNIIVKNFYPFYYKSLLSGKAGV
jgi:teichuronic acid biosynthesis glycosyltransferase TuaG